MVLIRTVWSLGPVNVARVVWYRFLKKAGFYRWRLPLLSPFSGAVFVADERLAECPVPESPAHSRQANLLEGRIRLFGHEFAEVGLPPAWHRNTVTGRQIENARQHWSTYADFDAGTGDIKCVWEASRFAWALDAARAYRLRGDRRYLDLLNDWTGDWLLRNPGNRGPNWMCSQEASIRMGHALLTDALLRQVAPCASTLVEFVEQHLERIGATVSYARAQANNHIISESVALLVGGAWLEKNAGDRSKHHRGAVWCGRGRRELERQLRRLVMDDGTFSQYSTTYHRVLLDNLSIAEWWRQRLGLEAFSRSFYTRAKSATDWLFGIVDPANGDAPNIGANDGALLFALCDTDYRDFRPSLQLAGALFCGARLYPADGVWNEPLQWLGINLPRHTYERPKSRLHRDGGFAVLRAGSDCMVCRFPVFHYRPSHADALHIDLWSNGENVLRDGGSYSYADADEIDSGYFSGTASHNTCQFDNRDQMPRLGRFLFGSWLHCDSVSFSMDRSAWSAAYTDRWGCHHSRSVACQSDRWIVTDSVSGFDHCAVIRWRLSPDQEWKLTGNRLSSALVELQVHTDGAPSRIELREGLESRHYLSQSKLPVLEVELPHGDFEIVTEIRVSG